MIATAFLTLLMLVLVACQEGAADPSDPPRPAGTAAPAIIERHVTSAPGVTLRVRDIGEGRPVLLLTGGPGFAAELMLPWARSIWTTRTWRAILPDQRGTGESTVDIVKTAFDLKSVVADLEAVREALHIEQWTIIGHSWGGVLGMAYSAAHPTRVTALGLVCPGGLEPSFVQRFGDNVLARLDPKDRAVLEGLRPAGTTLADFADMLRETNRLMAPGMLHNQDALPAMLALIDSPALSPEVSLAMRPMFSRLDLRASVQAYTGPVLVLQGEFDPLGREAADQIVAAFENATLEILPGVAHWPDLEDPATLFARLEHFLGETDLLALGLTPR